ncbi:MAG: hypothetical protein QOI61_67 [Actinomycetota bacterium]
MTPVRARPRRLLVTLGVILGCALFVNPYLRGDGNGYYAYVRSVVIDHDLKFQNEFAHGDPAFLRATHYDGKRFPASASTKPGYIRNQWSVGASLLWAPFFLAAHALVKVVGHWPADGYSFPYRWFCAFGTALYAALGLFLARQVAARVTDASSATLAVVTVLGASSLAIYMLFLPFWGLALATLPAAILVWQWSQGATWSLRRWFLYGAMVGLATTIHPLGIAWITLLAVAWFRDKGTLRDRVAVGAVAAAGFLVAEIPQMVIRAIAHGDALDTGYNVEWNFTRPPLVAELLSAKHGLFTWTPVALIAVVGLILLFRKGRDRLALGLGATFVVLLYLSAAYVTEEQSSFGNRMFVHFTPGFVVGLAVVVAALGRNRLRAATAAGAVLIAWNGLFAFQWAWGLLPKRGGIDWAQMVRQQFTTAPKELGSVAVRFFTDRDGLIDDVQRRDEERISRGEDGP